jgi:hypothetical protein
MEFFMLWVMTRVKERGWPRTEGVLRRRQFITDDVVIAAMQDAVRVAITIGGSLPDAAKSIAITCMKEDQALTRETVNHWIDSTSEMGDAKIRALSEISPQWLRLCSITAFKGNTTQCFLWVPGGDKYEIDTPKAMEMFNTAVALAEIAMCWSIRHPDKAQDLFYDPDGMEAMEQEVRELSGTRLNEEDLQEMVGAGSIHSGWLHIAETLVSKYSESVDFRKYEDLP